MRREGWSWSRVVRKLKSCGCVVRPVSPRRKRFGAWMGRVKVEYEGDIRGISRCRSEISWKRKDGGILGEL